MGLLELPQELRDMIFHHLIIKETNTITMLPDFNNSSSDISASPPSICNVNRQIRQETIPTFYAANRFCAQLDNDLDLDVARNWLSAIGEQNIRHLRQLSLCGWLYSCRDRRTYQRWLKIVFHVKTGSMEFLQGTDYPGDSCRPMEDRVRGLKKLFLELIAERAGKPFDLESAQRLMEEFNTVCTAQEYNI